VDVGLYDILIKYTKGLSFATWLLLKRFDRFILESINQEDGKHRRGYIRLMVSNDHKIIQSNYNNKYGDRSYEIEKR